MCPSPASTHYSSLKPPAVAHLFWLIPASIESTPAAAHTKRSLSLAIDHDQLHILNLSIADRCYTGSAPHIGHVPPLAGHRAQVEGTTHWPSTLDDLQRPPKTFSTAIRHGHPHIRSRRVQHEEVLKLWARPSLMTTVNMNVGEWMWGPSHEFHETCHSVTLIVLVNSHQRWKQTWNHVCFHLWCELTLALWWKKSVLWRYHYTVIVNVK